MNEIFWHQLNEIVEATTTTTTITSEIELMEMENFENSLKEMATKYGNNYI